MNKIRHVLTGLFGLLFFTMQGFSFENQRSEMEKQKIHIQAQDILLHKNQILVQIEGNWFPVNSLSVDAHGFSVLSKEIGVGFWECDRCGYVNYPWHFVCHNPNRCAYPR